MSDARIRELERLAAQGDPRATASLLAERVRVGAILAEDLRLAAYLGYPPARQALADTAPDVPSEGEEWVSGLLPWGERTLVQAARAAALEGHAVISSAQGIANLGRLLREGTRMVSAVERWLDERRDQTVFLPVFSRNQATSDVEEQYRQMITSLGRVAQDLAPWQRAHHAGACAGAAVSLAGPEPVRRAVLRAALPDGILE